VHRAVKTTIYCVQKRRWLTNLYKVNIHKFYHWPPLKSFSTADIRAQVLLTNCRSTLVAAIYVLPKKINE